MKTPITKVYKEHIRSSNAWRVFAHVGGQCHIHQRSFTQAEAIAVCDRVNEAGEIDLNHWTFDSNVSGVSA